MLDERYHIIQVFFWIGSLVLLVQVATIQLFSPKYRQKAETTTISKEVLYPSRGLIFDRNGKALVVNVPKYELRCIYNNISSSLDTAKFCSLLGLTKSDFISRIEKDWSSPMYSKSTPFLFLRNISVEHYATLQEHMHEFKGFYAVERYARRYPEGIAAHAIGYVGEVDDNILSDSTLYSLGDFIGKSGLEKKYEVNLRGQKGLRLTMKDNLGRTIGKFNDGTLDITPINGSDIITSLDSDLQRYAEKMMSKLVGSVVALDPSSGEVLAMVSSPYYDPNIMTQTAGRDSMLRSLFEDKLNPFFDRSIMAKYPPASIFKPVMGLIAMNENVAASNTSFYCPGYYSYEGFQYGCRSHPRPYNIDIALRYSCNSYFFQLFRNTIEHHGYKNHDKGLDILVDYLYEFGLGKTLGVDLPGEARGFVPTSRFYDQMYSQYQWKSTYIMSIGIGQGELQLTTLQMANLAAIIANKGYFITPHLIKGFMDLNKQLDPEFTTPKRVDIRPELFPPIIDGMENTVKIGTANRAYIPDISVCGKTGTSQNPQGEDHSVFFAFAPKENPQIAVAVYIESAGSGGAVAAPLGGLIIEKFLKGEVERLWLEEQLTKIDLQSKLKS